MAGNTTTESADSDPAVLFASVFRANNIIYQCTWIWFFFACLAFGLRVFTRIQLVKKFGWDDLTLVLGMMAYTAFTIILLFMRHYARDKESDTGIAGSNHDHGDEGYEVWYYSVYLWMIQSSLYIGGIALTRISVALLFLRIIPPGTRTWARRTSQAMIVLTINSTIIAFFINLFECNPVDKPRTEHEVTCIDETVLPLVIIIYSTISLVVDITFTCLPIAIICPMQMKMSKKLGAIVFLSLGLLASATILWRLVMMFTQDFSDIQDAKNLDAIKWYLNKNVLRLKVNMMLSWTIEQAASIVAASLATCKPVFKWVIERWNSNVHWPVLDRFRRFFPSRRPPSIMIPPLTPVPLGSPTSPNMPGDNAYTRRMAKYRQTYDFELASRGTPSTETEPEKHWPSSADEESPLSPAFPTVVRTNSTQALIRRNPSLTPTSIRSGDGIEGPQSSPTRPTMYERDVVPGLPTIPSGQVLSISHSQSQSTIQSIPVDYSELFLGMPATLTEAKIRESRTQGTSKTSQR